MKRARDYHLEGILQLDDDAGEPVDEATALAYKVDDEPLGEARQILPDASLLVPGQSTRVLVMFNRIGPMPPSLAAGRDLVVYRGATRIGLLHITTVLSPAAAGGTAQAPQEPSRHRSLALACVMLVLGLIYLALVAFTAYLAQGAYKPCTSDFEGACSLGRVIITAESLAAAGLAGVLGIPLKNVIARFFGPGTRIAHALILLPGVPFIYILTTLYSIFSS